MQNKLIRVTVEELSVGMYVAKLDRPWLETPFLFQGFSIESTSDIEQLSHYCEFVYIDTYLGVEPVHVARLNRRSTDQKIGIETFFPNSSLSNHRDFPVME